MNYRIKGFFLCYYISLDINIHLIHLINDKEDYRFFDISIFLYIVKFLI